ncbi:protein of unknown function [Hyphomicrobium sp. 1Nfss2.1]
MNPSPSRGVIERMASAMYFSSLSAGITMLANALGPKLINLPALILEKTRPKLGGICMATTWAIMRRWKKPLGGGGSRPLPQSA